MIDYSDEFAHRYLPFYDCKLSTFRNNLAFYGIVLSPSTILGLSGNLIFCYNDSIVNKRVLYPLITGINDQIIESLSIGFNCYLMQSAFEPTDNYFEFFYESLKKKIIVNISVNYFEFLKNVYNSEFNNKDLFDTANHFISVVGCCKEKKQLLIIDSNSSKTYLIDDYTLQKIWFKNNGIKSPNSFKGNWYSFFAPSYFSMEEYKLLSLNSIRKVILSFFSSSTPELIGIQALNSYKNSIYSWLDKSTDNALVKNGMILSYYFNKKLNGGGLARKQFAFFLNQVSTIFEDKTLELIIQNFIKSSEYWNEYLQCSFDAVHSESGLSSYEEKIKDIFSFVYHSEIKQMDLLKEWYNSIGLSYYKKLIID